MFLGVDRVGVRVGDRFERWAARRLTDGKNERGDYKIVEHPRPHLRRQTPFSRFRPFIAIPSPPAVFIALVKWASRLRRLVASTLTLSRTGLLFVCTVARPAPEHHPSHRQITPATQTNPAASVAAYSLCGWQHRFRSFCRGSKAYRRSSQTLYCSTSMKWSHSLAVAAFTGLIGLFAAGFATSLGVKWYDVHAFEGAEGFVVAACAILGLIAGFVVGLGLSRLVARSERPSAPKAAAVSAAALVVTIVAITTMARILADIPPLSEGEQLFLMVEVQTPVGYPSPDTLSGIGYLKLRHKERGPLFKEDVRFVDDRWVIPGVVRVFTSRG